MGLDFTSIPDREGVALYIIYDGSVQEERRWKEYVEHLHSLTSAQIFAISAHDHDAKEIQDFYDLQPGEMPVALAVRDDDEIAYKWEGVNMPTPEEVSHLLEEVGSS